jgi:hypothetical protein
MLLRFELSSRLVLVNAGVSFFKKEKKEVMNAN